MTTFNIPEIGTDVKLIEDWKFDLYNENRNKSFITRKKLTLPKDSFSNGIRIKSSCKIILPKGTVLRVDRIFIRKDMSDYSSMSFFIIDCPDTDLMPTIPITRKITNFDVGKVVRFWAKLDDCNRITY